jgi:hypothetical protein
MIPRVTSRIAVLGAGLVAVACCAGIPAIAAVLGGITTGALIGVVAGVITTVVIAVVALLFVRSRRRRARGQVRR